MPRREVNWNRKGANFELAVMHYLEAFGYEGIRSSGSAGAADIVMVRPDFGIVWEKYSVGGHLLFVQCKLTNPQISPAEREGIVRWAHWAGGRPIVASKGETTGTFVFRHLTGTGPKDWQPWLPKAG